MAPTTTTITHTILKATPNIQSKNHNSSENTSTLRKASVDATTSPGVIQPQATAPSAEAEAENVQPPPPGPLNEEIDRDARAYEHERQRVKQAGEWARRRARKANGQGGFGRPVVAGATHAGRRAKGFKSAKVGLDVDVDVYVVMPQRDMERTTTKIWDELGAGLWKRASLPPSGTDVSKATQGVRVNLSDLVVLSQRKPRKLSVDGFEVIPPIRSVIALDDVVNVHDMELDETWEHVYANDGIAQLTGPSYACVVGAGSQ